MKTLVLFASLFLISLSAFAQIFKGMDDLYYQYNVDTDRKAAKTIQSDSLKAYAKFIAMDVNSESVNPYFRNDMGKPVSLTKTNAKKTWTAASQNPVVSLYSYDKYDKKNEGIGFCFGRAMFIDLFVSINGLNRGSIKKAFVVGEMSDGGGGMWGWHVTTIVQSKNQEGKEIWLAIDPIVNEIMEVTEWYKEMLKSSTDGKLRLYIAQAGKFGVTPSRYDHKAMSDPYYGNYFNDMAKWFEKNDVSGVLGLKRKVEMPYAM
ncbi:MAG: hypothetical protein H0V66_05190 [Bdellovibrionales bacterium]|nr:hypothetical protein [Bdellovibrionales bacterium]